MVPLSSPRLRLSAVASLLGRPAAWLWPAAEPAVGVVAIAVAMLLAFRLTGRLVVAVVVGLVGISLAAWHWSRMLAAARDALNRSECALVAAEQALRRSQQIEALGRLTVGVAHDFNNHLTVIGSNVEMLARRLDRAQGRMLHHTEAAMQAVQRAAGLTGLLLSFASVRRQPDPEAVDVERLLQRVSDLLRRTLGGRIGFEIAPAEAKWFVWADIRAMENALLSLAVNARDRIGGAAMLTVAVANLRLDAGAVPAYPAVPAGDYIQITVGHALAANELRDWHTADDPGYADLVMARACVKDAGGFLLRSDPSACGLQLRMVLPRHAAPIQAVAIAPRTLGGPTTVLVVEDDAALRGDYVRMLSKLDYAVLEAPDAMEAFRLIADHGGIDLLFTDIVLPGGVSGRALAEAARNVDANMRVLFTTGHDEIRLPDRLATALLRKPFTAAQLAGMVQAVLGHDRPGRPMGSEARGQAAN